MFSLDDTDRAILRELQSPYAQWKFGQSQGRIAKRIKVDEETVRRRISKMEASGVIEGWTIAPNPNLLDRNCAGLFFESASQTNKEELVKKLETAEGILSLHSFRGGSILAYYYYPRGQSSTTAVKDLESFCGVESAESWEASFPHFDLELKPVDWRIVLALRNGPRSKLTDIAKKAYVSSRTLNRRLQRLIGDNAFRFETLVDVGKVAEPIFTILLRSQDKERKRRIDDKILARLGASCLWSDTTSRTNSVFSVIFDNYDEGRKMFAELTKLERVTALKMEVQESNRFVDSWIDSYIESKIPGWPRGQGEPTTTPRLSRPLRSKPRIRPVLKTIKKPVYTWTGSVLDGRKVKVRLERDLCMGTASCVELAPKVFRLDGTRKKSIFDPAPLEVLRERGINLEALFLAAQSCPYRAIALDDADTDEQLFP